MAQDDSGSENRNITQGDQLGPYKTDAIIGAGGMGEVFRATDTRLHRTVAIKVLPRDRRHGSRTQTKVPTGGARRLGAQSSQYRHAATTSQVTTASITW
jgi:serine/threonine protein kinase